MGVARNCTQAPFLAVCIPCISGVQPSPEYQLEYHTEYHPEYQLATLYYAAELQKISYPGTPSFQPTHSLTLKDLKINISVQIWHISVTKE